MMFIIQLMFMSLLLFSSYTPVTAGVLNLKYVMGYNSILGQSGSPYPKYPTFYHMGYSVYYYYNVNLMVGFQALAMITYIVYKIVEKYRGSDYEEAEQNSIDGDQKINE